MPNSCYHTHHQQHAAISPQIPPTPCISSLEMIIPERPWQQNSASSSQQTERDKLLMGAALADELRQSLPTRFKLLSTWILTYSTLAFGFSLSTLYSRCKNGGPAILAIKDDAGQLFGAFFSESISPQLNHFGSGECFLWKNNADHTTTIYRATGRSPFYIVAEPNFLAVGCGYNTIMRFIITISREGKFGLFLDGDLFSGESNQVSTFDNDILSSNRKFDIASVEVWTFK